jgi:hypothetical protein
MNIGGHLKIQDHQIIKNLLILEYTEIMDSIKDCQLFCDFIFLIFIFKCDKSS